MKPETIKKTDCPNCGGIGYTVGMAMTGVTAGCCGNPLPDGECCGNAVPIPAPEPVQEQCQWCYEFDMLAKAIRGE